MDYSIDQFDGFLMSRDVILAEIHQGKIEKIWNEALLPIYIARTHDLRHWLEIRAIDSRRVNSRLLKKYCGSVRGNDFTGHLLPECGPGLCEALRHDRV